MAPFSSSAIKDEMCLPVNSVRCQDESHSMTSFPWAMTLWLISNLSVEKHSEHLVHEYQLSSVLVVAIDSRK